MKTSIMALPSADRQEAEWDGVRIATSIRGCADLAGVGATRGAVRRAIECFESSSVSGTTDESVAELVEHLHGAYVCVEASLGAHPHPQWLTRRIGLALSTLEASVTSLDDVAAEMPEALRVAGGYECVVLSHLLGTTWAPKGRACDSQLASQVALDLRIGEHHTLVSGSMEAEVVRRRSVALRESTTAVASRNSLACPALPGASFAVAPLLVGDVVVGLIHVSGSVRGRPLSKADQVALRIFADGLGLIVERLALRRRLEAQRESLLDALAAAREAVERVHRAPLRLALPGDEVRRSERPHAAQPLPHGLTVREAEVLNLLVSGATNAQIADQLTLSETTVKSHVRHILRKLRVRNRAEAIARYLAMRSSAAVAG
jgi:DNA-binding CsgD family transcriptional regulator